MARLHGKSGSVTFAAGNVLHCFKWDCDRAQEVADGTEFGFVNRNADAGIKSASGTFSCYVDGTTPVTDAGTAGTGVFLMDSSRKVTAKLIITGFTIDVNLDSDEIVTYSWTLGGTDATGAATDFVIA